MWDLISSKYQLNFSIDCVGVKQLKELKHSFVHILPIKLGSNIGIFGLYTRL